MFASAVHQLWEAGFQGIVGTEVYEEAVLEKQQPKNPNEQVSYCY